LDALKTRRLERQERPITERKGSTWMDKNMKPKMGRHS
jgi:hypothetical protein